MKVTSKNDIKFLWSKLHWVAEFINTWSGVTAWSSIILLVIKFALDVVHYIFTGMCKSFPLSYPFLLLTFMISVWVWIRTSRAVDPDYFLKKD